MSDLSLSLPSAPGTRVTGLAPVRLALADARTMTVRALRISLRNVESLLTALALPVILMVMFVYLFGGAIDTGMHYVDYVVPGVLLVCVAFGASTTAVTVAADLSTSVIDRFRSMDVRSEALLNGHVVASVVRNAMSTTLVFVVALAIGFRSDADVLHWLGAIGILALFVLAMSWLAAAIGVAAGSPEAASGLTFLVTFLPYASSSFVPVETMPGWLQAFARNQPVTPVIDTIRGLLHGGPVAADAFHAVIWCVAITVGSIIAAGVLFRRRTDG